MNNARFTGQQRGRQNGQHGILGATDLHFAVQGHATFDFQTIHGVRLLRENCS